MELDLENPLTTFHQDLHSDSIPYLFLIETDHMPSHSYLQTLQSADLHISSVRRQAISLILQLSRNFNPFLSYLAVNYLDRFLSIQGVPQGKPWIVKLLALSCVSLAAKMKKTEFSLIDLQHDGGFIFDAQSIQRMESLILGALKWRMRSITPFSFISFFISLFKLEDPPLRQALKARATEILLKAQNEIKLVEFKPSIVAASALVCASHELFPLQFSCFRKAISLCSFVHNDKLLSCYDVMKNVVMDEYESVFDMDSSSDTPVNVLDRHWWSSESERTNNTEANNANNAIKLERDMKRRRVSGFRRDKRYQLSQIQQCRVD